MKAVAASDGERMDLATLGPACFALALAWVWYRAYSGNHSQRWVALVLVVTWAASMVAYAHLDPAGRIRTYGLLAFLAGAALLYGRDIQPRWVTWVGVGFIANLVLTLALYAQVRLGSPEWWAVYAWAITFVGYAQILVTGLIGAVRDDGRSRTNPFGFSLPDRISARLVHFSKWACAPTGKAEKSQ